MLPIRVYFEDTDAGGVVYHARYLNFMERARTEWLRGLGFEQDSLRDDHGVVFVVSRMEIDFLSAARFNEQLLVHTVLNQHKRVSMLFEQKIEKDLKILCQAKVRIACVEAQSFKPSAIPQPIMEALSHAK
jgi:acyl-CoA thioester hydrolase